MSSKARLDVDSGKTAACPMCPVNRPKYSSSVINWERLARWLSLYPPQPKMDPLPPGFRVIDVENQNVVQVKELPESFDYVCLSYVWGNDKSFQATTKNITSLGRSGALGSGDVPATIRDAMTACLRLGKRYLWVDRLCILQDNPGETKQSHINEMGRIYSHAIVTLVAYKGGGAGYGLHGVSDRMSRIHPMEPRSLEFSKWATRGWTYQEAVLSPRLIYFTSHDAIFEDDASSTEGSNRQINNLLCNIPRLKGAVQFADAITEYTSRDLGDQRNAFSGVFQHLFGCSNRFGIPLVGLEEAMHWFATGNSKQCRSGFPTWSWASVRGRCVIPFREKAVPIASWAFVEHDESGKLCLAYPEPRRDTASESPQDVRDRKWRLILAAVHASKYGYMSTTPSELVRLSSTPAEKLQYVFDDIWPSYQDFWEACLGISENQKRTSHRGFSDQHKQLASKPGRILVASQTATMDFEFIGKSREFADRERSSQFLLRDGKALSGLGSLDDPDIRDRLSSIRFLALSCCVLPKYKRSFDVDDSGRRSVVHFPMMLSLLPFESKLFWDFLGTTETSGCTYGIMNVLAIQATEEDGVFRRVGAGYVSLKKWGKHCHDHSTIILE
ncbi:heterokaryon incompatibility protein-domain-containing protein [Phyllosticta capitalensis]